MVGVSLHGLISDLDIEGGWSNGAGDDSFIPFFLPFDIGYHPYMVLEVELAEVHVAVVGLLLRCRTESGSRGDIQVEQV